MKKHIGLLFSIIFFLFAALQYNDVDPWVWIAIYAIVSIASFLQWMGKVPKKVLLLLSIAFFIGTLNYVPALYDWSQKGFPNIAGKMKATEMHVELVRESLGLLLSALALYYISIRTDK